MLFKIILAKTTLIKVIQITLTCAIPVTDIATPSCV